MQGGDGVRLGVLRRKLLAMETANCRGYSLRTDEWIYFRNISFQRNSFSASSFGFHLQDKSGKMRRNGVYWTSTSSPRKWETDERKRSSVSFSKWRVPREKSSAFHLVRVVQSLFYFPSYRCGSAAFFVVNRQGNNRRARRTRLAFSISSITLVKYTLLLLSHHANRDCT